GGCLGDIGTHAHNLAGFISGLQVTELAADLGRFVLGRRLDDNVHVLLRYDNGARGMLWASQVAPGNENALRLRINGEKAGLEWSQEHPNQLRFAPMGKPPQTLSRGGPNLGQAAAHATRIPPGHPEGYLEGFANLYRDLAEQIAARRAKRKPDPSALLVPTVEEGARGVKFIAAAVESSSKNGAWVDARLAL
ncbi:MAG: Gfo/Idh/MocA family protein, partial [Dongiaceae bacterium]